ncbi:MAG: hypothetical protein JXA42_17810 [Anaerolineales bacterium]|nr:hypothetical protein [Anaerolineales bacterium]
MKRTFKILGIVALVVAILGVAATITFAQDEPDTVSPELSDDLGSNPTPPSFGHHGRGRGLSLDNSSIFDTLSSELNMTVEEILAELEEGISIAQLAENHGADVESLIDALVSKAREMITEQVNTPWQARGDWNRMEMPGMRGDSILNSVAEALDMTVQEVVDELQTGISIADLVAEHDGDLDAIVEAYLAQYQERLDQAVEDGRIDQEQADTMMEEMATKVDEMVQTPWTEKSFGPGDPCGHPGGMRGGDWHQPYFDNDGSDTQGSGFTGPRSGGSSSGSGAIRGGIGSSL